MYLEKSLLLAALSVAVLGAQKAPRPIQAQSSSTFRSEINKEGERTIDITNVAYDVTWANIPGRGSDERLLLRKTTRNKEILGEKGIDATTTVDAWVLGTDLRQKPVYTISLSGQDCRTVEADLLEFARGLEEVEWWSIYKLGTGEHMFDTYAPLVKFSISNETVIQRYVGLEVPPDDTADARLKEAHVVAVLTYASPDKVMKEVLITADDPQNAALLRSYADTTHTVTLVEREVTVTAAKKPKRPPEPARSLRIEISENWPSYPHTRTIVIPIAKDDLDVAHAQVPVHMHLAAWMR